MSTDSMAVRGWLAGLLGLMLPAMAPAQDHSIAWKDGGCEIRFAPSAQRGEGPRLRLRVDARGQVQWDVALPSGAAQAEWVAGHRRLPFPETGPAPLARIRAGELWQLLDRQDRAGRPFWITARAGGGWISARYDSLPLAGVEELVLRACGQPAAVAAAPDPRNPFAESARPVAPPVTPPAPPPVAPGESEAERIAAETALALTDDQRRHIRWVLFARYARPHETPAATGPFAPQDRIFILRYRMENGLGGHQWLDRDLALRLLREPFRPRPPVDDPATRAAHRDWAATRRDGGATCTAETVATAASGPLYRLPRMEFRVDRAGTGAAMFVSLAEPNPFAGRVWALVDGQRIALEIREDQVKPLRDAAGTDASLMRAIRTGRMVVLEGSARDTGAPLRVEFSAAGFSAAFDAMARACGRTGLGVWFE